MNVCKSDDFIVDVERQFEWYAINASWEIAGNYLAAVEATCLLLERHPQLGPRGGFSHPRLGTWRFIVVFRPFQKHLVFFELTDDAVIMRRAMHGHRNLLRRLPESPGSA